MLLNETIEIQNRVAEYCKTGIEKDIPGVTPGRLHNYRRLIYNIVDDTMATAFPVTKKWLTPNEWDILISDFLKDHPAQTPQVWKLPFEFYEFVEQKGYADKFDKAAMNNLLFFEWLEIDIHTMPDKTVTVSKKNNDMLNDKLMLNPHSAIVRLEYPVHLMHAEKAADNKGEYFVIIYRNHETDAVHFTALSPLFAYFLDQLPVSLKEVIPSLSITFGIPDRATVLNGLMPFIDDCVKQTIIL